MIKYKNFFIFFLYFSIKKNRIDKLLSFYLVFFNRKYIFFFIKKRSLFINNIVFNNIFINNSCLVKFVINNILNKFYLSNLKKFINIIYEDNFLFIINKPSGFSVHPVFSYWDNNLIESLINYYGKKILYLFRFGVLHRLDKNSSGLIIILKKKNIFLNLLKQFKYNIISKYYFSININNNINKIFFNKIIGYINNFYKKYQNLNFFSMTNFFFFKHILYNNYKIFFIKSKLVTGRTHQLRMQFSYFNFPIIGDMLYNNYNFLINFKRHFLHCYNLFFFHPFLNFNLKFNISLDKNILNFLNFLFRDGGIWTLDSI